MRRFRLAGFAALAAAGLTFAFACTSLDDLSGTSPDAAAAPPVKCTCVAAPPVGWTGPFYQYDGNPANEPRCPAEAEQVLRAFADMTATPPATCSACACTPNFVGAHCADAGGEIFGTFSSSASDAGGFCPNSCNDSLVSPGTCASVVCSPGARGFHTTFPQLPPPSGACIVDGGTPTLPPTSWGRVALGCRSKASGSGSDAECTAGEVCAVTAPTPFTNRVCVLQNGDVACPGAPYSEKTVYFGDVDDTRGCAPCECQAACAVDVQGYAEAGCGSPLFPRVRVAEERTCVALTGLVKAARLLAVDDCKNNLDSGRPTGTAVPRNPITVCCSPK